MLSATGLCNLGLDYYIREDKDRAPGDYEKARLWFERAFEKASSDAAFYLGLMYRDGHGVAPDFIKAVEYFEDSQVIAEEWEEKASPLERLSADELYKIGESFYLGQNGVPQDYLRARIWFERAQSGGFAQTFEQGYVEAGFYLGLIYRDGKGVAPDFLKAIQHFEDCHALEVGLGQADPLERLSADELRVIGRNFYWGENGAPKNYLRARTWFERARNKGDATACYYLGMIHRYGDCGPISYSKARAFYEESAKKGEPNAKRCLDELNQLDAYELVKIAEPYYKPGPDCDYDEACGLYEWILEKGLDCFNRVPKLLSLAVAIFNPLSSRRQLYTEICLRTGLMYISSKHPKPDFDKGIRYLHRAAKLGYIPAQKALNSLKPDNTTSALTAYVIGNAFNPNSSDHTFREITLKPNASLARLWYEEAARKGEYLACNELGEMYEKGEGVAADPVKAAQYYQKAINLGHPGTWRLDCLFISHPETRDKAAIDPTLTLGKSSWAEDDVLEKFRLAAANDHEKIKDLILKHPELLDAGCPVDDSQLIYNVGVALGKTTSYGGAATAGAMVFPPSIMVSAPLATLLSYLSWEQGIIDSRSRKGWTMLEFAAEAQAIDVVEELIGKGAKITPLFLRLVNKAKNNISYFDRLNALFRNSQSFAQRCLNAIKRQDASTEDRTFNERKLLVAEEAVKKAGGKAELLQFELYEKDQEITEHLRFQVLFRQEFKILFLAARRMAGTMIQENGMERGLFDKALGIPSEMAKSTGKEKIKYFLGSQKLRDPAELDLSKIDNIDDLLMVMKEQLALIDKIRQLPNEDLKKRATALHAKFESGYNATKQYALQKDKPVVPGVKVPPKAAPVDAKKPGTSTPSQPKQQTQSQAKPLPKSEEVEKRKTIPTRFTEGNGDCAFHAIFGKWDGEIVRCENVKEKREQLARGIERNDQSIREYILLGIQELVMDNVVDIHGKTVIHDKPAMIALQKALQEFDRKNVRDYDNAWKAFEEKLKENIELMSQIDDFIKQLPPEVQETYDGKSLKVRFDKTLNDDKEHKLKDAIDKNPQLMPLYNEVKKYDDKADFWGNYQVTDDVLKEFASYIETMGIWLGQHNIYMIAFFFDISVDLYEKDSNTDKGGLAGSINPGQKDKVAICFDGIGHYEQVVETEVKAAATPETPASQTDTKEQPASSSTSTFFKPVIIRKEYAFGLVEARAIYDDTDTSDDVLFSIIINLMINPVKRACVQQFYNPKSLRMQISNELQNNPAKYKTSFELNVEDDVSYEDWCQRVREEGTPLTTLEIEAFCERHKIPCFLARGKGQGGIYMGSQYKTPDNPPMLIGINDNGTYRALEMPKGKDMAWLETKLQSDSVGIVDYETETESAQFNAV
ncbi:TPR repeat protein [Legionella geestiana]|uniref:TPR repeat protein n=1 Tax=Legionella geestiana TaxID=45065 RepID=A0A0W0U8K4_9GAMM|nr:sel1 repeat family protein [Legionella geestiana]KTD04013.1 TPR repeat protein [Legionella geestiana]QBS12871.1 sel1 repeat family protein [Legionella geestiana]STX54642.1 TPR repeat protein [Legionella geestiana]